MNFNEESNRQMLPCYRTNDWQNLLRSLGYAIGVRNSDDSDEQISEVKNVLKSDAKPESSKELANSKESESLKASFVDLTLSDDDEEAPREKEKQENEAQAVGAAQPVAVVRLKQEVQVQPQQAVTSSEQGEVIEIDSPSPPASPTPTTPA